MLAVVPGPGAERNVRCGEEPYRRRFIRNVYCRWKKLCKRHMMLLEQILTASMGEDGSEYKKPSQCACRQGDVPTSFEIIRSINPSSYCPSRTGPSCKGDVAEVSQAPDAPPSEPREFLCAPSSAVGPATITTKHQLLNSGGHIETALLSLTFIYRLLVAAS